MKRSERQPNSFKTNWERALRFIAYAWAALLAVPLLVALSGQLWLASILYLIAILAAFPPVWPALRGPGKLRAAASVAAFFFGMMAHGSAIQQTPEGKARRKLAEREEAKDQSAQTASKSSSNSGGARLDRAARQQPAQATKASRPALVQLPTHETQVTTLAMKSGKRVQVNVRKDISKAECIALVARYRSLGGPDGQISVRKPSAKIDELLTPWCVENFDGRGVSFNDDMF